MKLNLRSALLRGLVCLPLLLAPVACGGGDDEAGDAGAMDTAATMDTAAPAMDTGMGTMDTGMMDTGMMDTGTMDTGMMDSAAGTT